MGSRRRKKLHPHTPHRHPSPQYPIRKKQAESRATFRIVGRIPLRGHASHRSIWPLWARLLPDDEKYQIRIRFHRRVQTSTHHLHLRERFGTSYLQSHRPGSRSAGVLPLGRKSIHFVPVSPICSDRFGKAQGCPCQNSGVVALGRIGHCRKRSYRAGKNQHIKSG